MSTSPASSDQKRHPALGWICIGIGSYIIGLASGILPVDPQSVYVPMSIFGLTGLIVFLGGVMILLGQKSRYNDLAAGVLLACFAIVGAWVSIFSSSDSIEGGLPFLSDQVNALIGRIIFGVGALLSGALSVYAFSLFWKKK